ncbi:type VII secretion integral membrane protein EccD [Arthrobacter caoxuetaonis]|uniref:Type VII secretion integral membrane protein EccD n=1 Tax=Arthrobacter caoxuetaonis TaxID=2886935 RepID=A0A9X1SC56_9MICC|nr:type VII secretion integral membrane protein EccD [Arthrobacter caoxuetaonis]MCC3297177.1 type VII secretion integral membrane protein EccD [Arthrobacter caoxuetaonis]USQ58263.1 type VII secretion integral membrane protein EccD [Arthrobacter caoxuetaonis]
MAHAYTRVTLVGRQRHLDLLLPSDQPVAALMPQVLELLGDEPSEDVAAKVLVAPDGTELTPGDTLAGADVLDGTSLQLCNASEAPPAPIVYDVTDLVVAETEAVRGRWNQHWKNACAGVFAAVGLWTGAELLLEALAPGSAWWLLAALSLLTSGAGVLLARRSPVSPVGPAALGAAWLIGLGSSLHAAGILGGEGAEDYRRAGLILAGATVVALMALGAANRQPKAMYTGALVSVLAAAGWSAAVAATGSAVQASALAGIASVLLLGLLPGLALAASGLAALDDQRAKGGQVGRPDALESVASAHTGLAVGAAVTAASAALAFWLLGTDSEQQAWSLPLLAVLTLAVFLRARAFPLAPERLALYAATAVGLAALMAGSSRWFAGQPWVTGALVLALAAAVWIALSLNLPDHTQARFRLAAKRLETLAILASVPLAAGMFGIFAQLLESF